MTSRFKGRAAARRMACVAITGTAGIVRPGTVSESRGGMAEVAVQAGRNMRGNRVYLTGCGISIVTGLAVVGDAGMVEGRRYETAG